MPINQETFNKNLYDLLRTKGLDPKPLNFKGENTPVPNDADVFKIQIDGKNVWITIDNAKKLRVYFDDNVSSESNDESEQSFYDLLKHLKYWAQRRQLGFELQNRDHLASDMAQREHMRKKETLGEGYHPMGKKASYSDTVPQVKIILQHTRQIEEGEQRFRNIAKIFVENTNGERFLVPTIRPGLARVYARHIAEGGTPYDERGQHITSLVEEYTKMAGFVRATRNGQFNESAQQLVNEGINHYQNLRETLSRMTGHRGYNQYFENYTPVLNEESDDNTSLNELFVQETLDPRIESVLPILKRLNKNISEMNEVKQLEEWAESLTEVEDETTQTLAEPADEMLEGLDELKDSLNNAVMRRIMSQHPKLLKDLDNLEMAIDDAVSWFVGDGVEEVGSSDISAIVKDVTQRMEERHADINEAPGAETLAHNQSTEKSNLKAFDLEEGFSPSEEVADMIMKSMGGAGKLTSDDIYRAVDEYQSMMDNPEELDTEEVAQIIIDKLHSKGIMVPDISEDLDANQKRVGQLGPTEKVGSKGAVGKLVGASESVELDRLKLLSNIK